jgi:hypothetical protein
MISMGPQDDRIEVSQCYSSRYHEDSLEWHSSHAVTAYKKFREVDSPKVVTDSHLLDGLKFPF